MLVTLSGIEMDVRPEQSLKVLLPMLVTLLGIETDVRQEQPKKADSPMLVTLLGIVTDVRPEQTAYLQLVVCQSILSKTVEK